MSTIIGKKLEDEVAGLLGLAHFDVQREILIGHKRVDLLVLEKRLGSIRRIGVECKNLNRKLTKEQVNLIYSDYRSLCDNHLIDEILIVTDKGLSPSALSMVEATRDLNHMTLDDVFNLVMDFRPYLEGLERQFDEQGLSSYYIQPSTMEGQNFEALIFDWIKSTDSSPIAVLGSYGTGKTTLARRIASTLASRAKEYGNNRIPILLRLGEISSEQSLEGLLGKLFTAHSVVRNYTFDLFMNLNRMGHFVVILDGFDEMKHTLTWLEFKYNFRQLNRLISEHSKVIILGRPTAFLNDEEYRHALRGIRSIGGLRVREPDWPEYKEHHLAPFTETQARQFLQKYLSYRRDTSTDTAERHKIEHVIEIEIDNIFAKNFLDLSRRPVQLKMLAEILPSWKGNLERLTVSQLYSSFIDIIIEREQDKIARRHFDLKERRSFARQLAIFLWLDKGEMSITADNIPADLITPFCRSNQGTDPADPEAVKRDLVSACFLDRKFGDSLFFPHRSFQEFLIAEALIDDLNQDRRKFTQLGEIVNEEICNFVTGTISIKELRQWTEAFERSTGTITPMLAAIWLSQPESEDLVWKKFKNTNSPWYPMLLSFAMKTGKFNSSRRAQFLKALLQRLNGPIGKRGLSFLWSIMQISKPKDIGIALQRATRVEQYSAQEGNRQRFIPDFEMTEFFSRLEPNESSCAVGLKEAYDYLFSTLPEFCLIGDVASPSVSVDHSPKLLIPFRNEMPEEIVILRESIDAIFGYQFTYCGRRRRPWGQRK